MRSDTGSALVMLPLSELTPGQRGQVVHISGPPPLLQRLYEMGLLEGETVEMLGAAPLGDPLEIRLGNTRLSLRKSEAASILVRPGDP